MVQKTGKPAASAKSASVSVRGGRTEAPRPAARLPARDRARQGARPVPQGRFCRHVARRSQRRHRHEPAQPLWRVRRQARALHQELPALPRRRPRRDDRHFQGRTADPQTAGAHLRGGARHLSLRRCRAARLLHGDDGGVGGGVRSRDPRHGAGRVFRTRQGVRRLLQPRQREGRVGVNGRSASPRATCVGDHPHHRDPRPGADAAQAARSDREGRDRS